MIWPLILLAALLAGLTLWDLLRGRVGYGEHAVARVERPGRYWLHLIGFASVGAAFLASEYHRIVTGDMLNLPVWELVMAAACVLAVVSALRSGHALDPDFSREHEPGQYWFLVALSSVLALMLIALAVFRLARL